MKYSRDGTIYVSRKTLRRLRWIRDAYPGAFAITSDALANARMSLDEIADKWLNEFIEERFPGIVPAEKLSDKAEDQAIETIRTTTTEKANYAAYLEEQLKKEK